jgi:putative hydrolase of the HAD superfamily
MSPVAAIVFDLDGTLFDHEASVRAALYHWLPPFSDTVDEADVVPGFRAESEEFERLTAIWFSLEERAFAAWRAGEITWTDQRRLRLREFLRLAGMPNMDAHLDTVFAAYLAAYQARWRPFPDAVKCLKSIAKKKISVAVLTNGLQTQQVDKTVVTGLAPLCGPVFASSGIGVAKPDAESYLLVCERLGVSPADTVMVGDNYELDVRGAREAGLRAVHLDRLSTHRIADPSRIATLRELRITDPELGTVKP